MIRLGHFNINDWKYLVSGRNVHVHWTKSCILEVFQYIAAVVLSYNTVILNWIFKYLGYFWLLCPPNRRGGGTYCFWCGSLRCRHCSLSALYLLNEWVDFDQICIDTLLGKRKEVIRFWWPWSHFQGHTSTDMFKFWPKKACVHPISWTKWRILAKLHIL